MELKRRYLSTWRNRKWFTLFLLPSFIGVTVFVLLPFADVVKRSFTTSVTGQWQGLDNYRNIFHNEAFRLAVKNTLRFTAICIPLLVFLGFIIAMPLSRLRYQGVIKSLYLLPLAMPTATVVVVWKLVFYEQGFLNGLLSWLGTTAGKWGIMDLQGAVENGTEAGFWSGVHTDYLGTDSAFWVLVGSYLWKNTGYTIVLWLAGILAIPKEVLEAAQVDGAGRWQQTRCIILPDLKVSLYVIVTLSFLNSFKIYREAYLVAGSYPHESMYLLQHLFNNWFVNLDFDKMAAASVCMGAVIFAGIMLLQRVWDKAGEEG